MTDQQHFIAGAIEAAQMGLHKIKQNEMIQASELRINNWVYLSKGDRDVEGGEILKIYQISGGFDLYKLDENDCADIQPIIIDEGWLIRAGFEKGMKETFRTNSGFHAYVYLIGWPECDDPDMPLNLYFDNEGALLCALQAFNIARIKYVHQLQNLYFAITGTELFANAPNP
jgi:hypothetical protein